MDWDVGEHYLWQCVGKNVEELFASWVGTLSGALLELVADALVGMLCEVVGEAIGRLIPCWMPFAPAVSAFSIWLATRIALIRW